MTTSPSDQSVSLARQAARIRHDIAVRTKLYRNLVAAKKMRQGDATRELNELAAVLETLESLLREREAA